MPVIKLKKGVKLIKCDASKKMRDKKYVAAALWDCLIHGDSEAFKEAQEIFIDSTEDVVFDKIIPAETYYDVRLRLLFNRREDLKPGESYGTIHDWQGKFRAPGETQKYGTPTIWLLDADGVILEEAFHGNIYQDQELSYTVLEVDKAIQKHLQ